MERGCCCAPREPSNHVTVDTDTSLMKLKEALSKQGGEVIYTILINTNSATETSLKKHHTKHLVIRKLLFKGISIKSELIRPFSEVIMPKWFGDVELDEVEIEASGRDFFNFQAPNLIFRRVSNANLFFKRFSRASWKISKSASNYWFTRLKQGIHLCSPLSRLHFLSLKEEQNHKFKYYEIRRIICCSMLVETLKQLKYQTCYGSGSIFESYIIPSEDKNALPISIEFQSLNASDIIYKVSGRSGLKFII